MVNFQWCEILPKRINKMIRGKVFDLPRNLQAQIAISRQKIAKYRLSAEHYNCKLQMVNGNCNLLIVNY